MIAQNARPALSPDLAALLLPLTSARIRRPVYRLPLSRGAARVALSLARGVDVAHMIAGDFGPAARDVVRM